MEDDVVGEVNDRMSPLLSRAIVVWTGYGRTSWPARDEQLVEEEFGARQAVALVPLIRELQDDFYSSDARFTVADVAEMGKVAATQFRAKHPEIAEEAVQALAWCYTYDYK